MPSGKNNKLHSQMDKKKEILAKKLAAELYEYTELERRNSKNTEYCLQQNEKQNIKKTVNLFENFDNILANKSREIRQEIDRRINKNTNKNHKFGKDLAKKTETLRKNIVTRKKSDILNEMKEFNKKEQNKTKLIKSSIIIQKIIIKNALYELKNNTEKQNPSIKLSLLKSINFNYENPNFAKAK